MSEGEAIVQEKDKEQDQGKKQEKAESKAASENETGVMPPEAEHTFAERTLNTVEKPDFDGPSKPAETIDQAYRIEREGGKLSPEGLGHMAGSAVLAQYRAAKAEVGARWWQLGAHMMGSRLLTCTVPVVALIAGGAIDVAIFGGAANGLMQNNPWFTALAGGSLVFAAGIGLSEHKGFRVFLGGLLVTASIGASMLAADNPNFKGHFANMLPQSLRSQSYTADESLAKAEAQAIHFTEKLARDRDTLDHGGIGGKPILGDGYTGNDEQGRQLINVTIPEDEKLLGEAKATAASLTSNKKKTDAESPATWWGQILGAGYLGAWLIASQLVVATVIAHAASTFRKGRKETAQRRVKELFVHDLESSRGEAAARVAVGDMVHRYRDAMTNACKKNPVAQEVKTRLCEIDTLFSGENMGTAIQTGAQMVKDAVHPRRERFEEDDKNQSGLMGTVVSLAQRRKDAASGNKPNNTPAP